jgi:RNA polymerase sigma factor (sigma-70 family)
VEPSVTEGVGRHPDLSRVQQALDGDEQERARLYLLVNELRPFVRHRIWNPALQTEEVIEEVLGFLTLNLEKLMRQYEGRASFQTYLVVVGVNRVRSIAREQYGRDRNDRPKPAKEREAQERRAGEKRALFEQFRPYVKVLDRRDQYLIAGYYQHLFTLAKMAEDLGVDHATARQRKRRAVRRLLDTIALGGGDCGL